MSSNGLLGRAAAVAARHSSYRVEGRDGAARAVVDLNLPSDWRSLEEFSGLLAGEKKAEYAVDGASISGKELF